MILLIAPILTCLIQDFVSSFDSLDWDKQLGNGEGNLNLSHPTGSSSIKDRRVLRTISGL